MCIHARVDVDATLPFYLLHAHRESLLGGAVIAVAFRRNARRQQQAVSGTDDLGDLAFCCNTIDCLTGRPVLDNVRLETTAITTTVFFFIEYIVSVYHANVYIANNHLASGHVETTSVLPTVILRRPY